MGPTFQLSTQFSPAGDQPAAIKSLVEALERGERHQTLLGITGSGKTFTIANVIAQVNRPALIMAPNKTLAAQLYSEMSELFPNNAVEYFVSYYDYYQPEAYIPASDTFIEKDSLMNEQLDRMRHSTTRSLLSRRDVIIVASVSCIYGIGSAEWYQQMLISLRRGEELRRDELLRRLVDIQYERNDIDFHRGTFRVRGDVVEVFPAYEHDLAVRVEYFGDEIDRITEIDPMRGTTLRELERYGIYPGSHYVTPDEQRARAVASIRAELAERLTDLHGQQRLLEAQRLEQRTQYDLEMLEQMGFCHGIENYARHLSNREPGQPPPCLIDYMPEDFILIMDESHQSLPQVAAMYRGDRARKETLVEHGFRLPSALDNRPLKFEEFTPKIAQAIYVSATPGDYELEQCQGEVIEQVIRPTGLMDPPITVRPVHGQVDDLLGAIRKRIDLQERVLVTTLTKRMAEDLSEYYTEMGIRCRYLHSDVDTLERVEILRELRLGHFDVLIGINLLREGLDIPEVSLVAILDADKEGFLRSPRSLIQTSGRAARNARGEVYMYADRITAAMQLAIDETERRRKIQAAYNEKHGITPASVQSRVKQLALEPGQNDYVTIPIASGAGSAAGDNPEERIEALRAAMLKAAEELEFERAAALRDELMELETSAGLAATGHAGNGPAKKKTGTKSQARKRAKPAKTGKPAKRSPRKRR